MCIRDRYGFAWMNFPGRKVLFILVIAMIVVPLQLALIPIPVSYTHLRAHETVLDLVCRLLLEKKK